MMAAPQAAKQPKSIIEIYTDWANHYLDKLRGCSRIKDLQTELSDGLVLSDVIEGVTGTKVPDVQRKPKNNPQVQTSQYN
jgi:neuron navigator 2